MLYHLEYCFLSLAFCSSNQSLLLFKFRSFIFSSIQCVIGLYVFMLDAPEMVPDVIVDDNTIGINGNTVFLTLSWEEPFNNFDPIVNYIVSCSGNITCPINPITTDNTTRSYTIANLTTMTAYTFTVVATNSFGSGEVGIVNVTTPGMFYV